MGKSATCKALDMLKAKLDNLEFAYDNSDENSLIVTVQSASNRDDALKCYADTLREYPRARLEFRVLVLDQGELSEDPAENVGQETPGTSGRELAAVPN
jgi:hypothetical protein